MAVEIEHQQPSPPRKSVTIWVDHQGCAGCGEKFIACTDPYAPYGKVTLEEALRHVLCENCKAVISAWRFLTKPDQTSNPKPVIG